LALYITREPITYVQGDRTIHITEAGRLVELTKEQADLLGSKVAYWGSGNSYLAPRITVLAYDNATLFPVIGSPFHVYLAQDSGRLYTWNESTHEYTTVAATSVTPGSIDGSTPLGRALLSVSDAYDARQHLEVPSDADLADMADYIDDAILAERSAPKTLTNTTFNSATNSFLMLSTAWVVADPTVQTKRARFDVSAIDPGTTKVFYLPGGGTSGTLVTEGAAQTLANKTLQSPVLVSPRSEHIYNTDGAVNLHMPYVADADNWIFIRPAAQGQSPTLGVWGWNDENVSLQIATRGTGVVQINGDNVVTANANQTLSNKIFNNGTSVFVMFNHQWTLANYFDGAKRAQFYVPDHQAQATRVHQLPEIDSKLAPLIPQGQPANSANIKPFGVPGMLFYGQGLAGLVANNLFYWPFWVRNTLTINEWIFEVTTGPSSNANVRLGIYPADSAHQPTAAPLYDSGDVSVANGFTGIKTASGLSVTLTPGIYLLAMNVSHDMTMRALACPSPALNVTLGSASLYVRYFVPDVTYGALPTTPQQWSGATNGTSGLMVPAFFRWTE